MKRWNASFRLDEVCLLGFRWLPCEKNNEKFLKETLERSQENPKLEGKKLGKDEQERKHDERTKAGEWGKVRANILWIPETLGFKGIVAPVCAWLKVVWLERAKIEESLRVFIKFHSSFDF
jgi:hypothetical protein